MGRKLEAQELLRQTQQGLGKPIIAEKFKGYQFVAVGNSIRYGKWKTFHDFLLDYIRVVLGSEWGNAELKKPLKERHPMLQWYDSICNYQRETIKMPGKVNTAPMTGAISAYMGLSYNLYLLAHNVELRNRLVARLKDPSQFRGAYYETFVAACFILAGFDLSLEDEDDPTLSHTEFVATSKETGSSYSVEAKSRAPDKAHADIGNQIAAALRKRASHPRVVFVDVNIPHHGRSMTDEFLEQTLPRIKGLEGRLKIRGAPAPPAYIIATNHPYHYDLESTGISRAVIGAGFKIPDFGCAAEFDSLISAFNASEKHADIISVLKAFGEHQIPSTFDGEIPEFAFGDAERRFTIGETYDLSEIEPGIAGELTTATVSDDGSTAHLAFYLQDGSSRIVRVSLTEAETRAYHQHPETFFGINLKPGGRAETPFELFKFFHESYKKTPREKLLGWLKNAEDFDHLATLSQEELVLHFCERNVHAAMAKSRNSETS